MSFRSQRNSISSNVHRNHYGVYRHRGYTLIEVILALTILAAGVLGVYMMLKPASINAGIEQEQKQLSSLVTGVRAGFGTTQGNFDGLTLAAARNLRLTGVNFSGNTLVSALGDNILLRPATVFQVNDGFDAVYQNLNPQKCIAYIKAFSPQTHTILVDTTQTKVQTTTGVNEGRLVGADTIVQACNSNNFKSEQGQVVFRFYQPSSKSVVAVENVCSCSPRSQSRELDCASGQAGAITQQRTSACSGGTTACPTEVWSTWSTSSNTCSGGSPSGNTNVNVTESDNTCIPTTQERTQACPSGYNGSIVEQRTSTCANAAAIPTWGSWAVTGNTCVVNTTETYSCTPSVQTRNLACPSPYLGTIEQERSSTCASATATPTWGSWVEQERNCSFVCVPGQTCCQPMPDQYRDVSCNAGFYGQVQEERSSYCASATSPMTWNSWLQVGSSCTACPAPLTQRQYQDDPRTESCPSGATGSITYDMEQERTRIRTYDCSPSPVVLPPADYTSWTSWSDTGVKKNYLNTCISGGTGSCDVSIVGLRVCAAGQCKVGSVYNFASSLASTTATFRVSVNVDGVAYDYQDVSCNMNSGSSCSNSQTYQLGNATVQLRVDGTMSDGADEGSGTVYTADVMGDMTYTCIPKKCSIPAGTAPTWTVGSYTCNGPALGSTVTIDSGTSRAWSDVTAPTVGNASFQCTEGVLASAPNAGATCKLSSCSVPAGTTRTWTVGSDTCSATTSSATTVAYGATQSFNDTAAPATGQASFACDASGSLKTVAEAGASCSVACTAPSPTTTSTTRNLADETQTVSCQSVYGGVAGDWTGDIDQKRTVQENGTITTTWTCPGPTSSSSTTWLNTYQKGSWVTTSNTCSSTKCVIPSGTTRTWTVGGQTCNGPALGAAVTISNGATHTWTDVTTPTTGQANFTCNNGTLSTTANAGATCGLACTAPSPTSTATSRTLANGTRTLACHTVYGGVASDWSGDIDQEQTITQDGTITTTWSCPGPTSSTSTTWGTKNYGSWFTVSDTCTATCSAPSPTTVSITRGASDETQTLACPAGQVGAITQSRSRTENGTRTTSWTCPGPTSSTVDKWLGTYNNGSWVTTSNTCKVDGACPTRPIDLGCGVFKLYYPYEQVYPVQLGDYQDNAFDDGQKVVCAFGYSDVLDAQGFPTALTGSDSRMIYVETGYCDALGGGYGSPQECTGYLTVYAKKADGTRGNQCYGQAKLMFNYEGGSGGKY